jgi:hypothetical protein
MATAISMVNLTLSLANLVLPPRWSARQDSAPSPTLDSQRPVMPRSAVSAG